MPRHGQTPRGGRRVQLLVCPHPPLLLFVLRGDHRARGLHGGLPPHTDLVPWPGGPHGTPGLRLLSDVPREPRAAATSHPGRAGAGITPPRGRVRLCSPPSRRPCPRGAPAPSKIILFPPPPPSAAANARLAQPPRLLPGYFWEQIPFPGCRHAGLGRAGLALGLLLFPGMTQELPTPKNQGEVRRGATGAGQEEEEAPGTCSPRGRGAALLLVPDDEVEEVFVDVGFPGEQGAAQLLAAMAEGAGEVEIFIAARGTDLVSRGGFAQGRGRGARGLPLPWGGEDRSAAPLRLPQAWERGCGREGAQSWEPPSPYATAHTITRGGWGRPCHVAGAERQSGEGCGVPEVRGCRHFPGYPLCSEPVTKGNTLRTGQRRGVPGGAAAAGAAASHAPPTAGARCPTRPPLSPRMGMGTEALTKEHGVGRGQPGSAAPGPSVTSPGQHRARQGCCRSPDSWGWDGM